MHPLANLEKQRADKPVHISIQAIMFIVRRESGKRSGHGREDCLRIGISNKNDMLFYFPVRQQDNIKGTSGNP